MAIACGVQRSHSRHIPVYSVIRYIVITDPHACFKAENGQEVVTALHCANRPFMQVQNVGPKHIGYWLAEDCNMTSMAAFTLPLGVSRAQRQ